MFVKKYTLTIIGFSAAIVFLAVGRTKLEQNQKKKISRKIHFMISCFDLDDYVNIGKIEIMRKRPWRNNFDLVAIGKKLKQDSAIERFSRDSSIPDNQTSKEVNLCTTLIWLKHVLPPGSMPDAVNWDDSDLLKMYASIKNADISVYAFHPRGNEEQMFMIFQGETAFLIFINMSI